MSLHCLKKEDQRSLKGTPRVALSHEHLHKGCLQIRAKGKPRVLEEVAHSDKEDDPRATKALFISRKM